MISNKALLVSINIKQWVGRKLDKTATNTVELSHLTQAKVGNFTKKLLPGAKELDNIHALSNNMRVFFYKNTLPWLADGTRILSSKNYFDFTNEFRTIKADFDRAVSEFLNEYPNLQDMAKSKLGDLFRATEYPSIDRLKDAFGCEVSFMPLPEVSDFRVEISEDEKKQFIEKMQDTENKATKECWSRLFEVVSRAAVKLNDPESQVRDSLIENISEICSLLPKLNITDDPNLESMRQSVEQLVGTIRPEVCREIPSERLTAANKLNDITSKMSAFMSG